MIPYQSQNIWEESIERIETDDLILAGPNGKINIPLKQLANRTEYLRNILLRMESELDDIDSKLDDCYKNLITMPPCSTSCVKK